MMTVKKQIEMNKIAFAALLIGAFALNPLAKAEEIPSPAPVEEEIPDVKADGLKFNELKNITEGFGVRVEGDQLVFSGKMPRKCLEGRVMTSVESDATKGEHSIKIDMPACSGKALSQADRKSMVAVSLAFPAKSFDANIDGKFCLKNSPEGDGKYGCDPILGKDGKQLEHISLATIATHEAKEKDRKRLEDEKKVRQDEERNLLTKIGELCRAGDFQTISRELEAATWLGDLTKVLNELGLAKTKSLEGAIRKAKNPEDLRVAYDALAADPTYDSDKAVELYGNRRMEMFRSAIEDKSQSVSSLASVIREMESDLGDIGETKKAKEAASWAYTALGNRLRDDKDFTGAENQYEKALRYADLDGKIKIEQEMAKMFLAAAEECLKENKLKPAKCDALAKKARKHMDKAIAAQGRKRGDDAVEALAGMKMEKIQTFGVDGINVKVNGYGTFNPYGGSYDMQKRQVYQTGMQEEYMKRIMQMQVGGMGATSNSGSSFFR